MNGKRLEMNGRRPGKPAMTVALWLIAAALLLAVFALYTRPEFMITLANQVWLCF